MGRTTSPSKTTSPISTDLTRNKSSQGVTLAKSAANFTTEPSEGMSIRQRRKLERQLRRFARVAMAVKKEEEKVLGFGENSVPSFIQSKKTTLPSALIPLKEFDDPVPSFEEDDRNHNQVVEMYTYRGYHDEMMTRLQMEAVLARHGCGWCDQHEDIEHHQKVKWMDRETYICASCVDNNPELQEYFGLSNAGALH